MKRTLFALLFLAACGDTTPPHKVTICTAGHWGEQTLTGFGRGGTFEYTEIGFICDTTVTQCQAGSDFIGVVNCG